LITLIPLEKLPSPRSALLINRSRFRAKSRL
jgi:hypothetical protein